MKLTEFDQQVKNLFKTYPTPQETLLHATTGLCGEAGELVDAFKKVWIYGKELDRKNVIEELGDTRFYLTAAMQSIGLGDKWNQLRKEVKTHEVAYYVHLESPYRPVASSLCAFLMHESVILDELAIACVDTPEVYAGVFIDSVVKIYTIIRAIEVMIDATEIEVEIHKLHKLSKGKKARYKDGYSDEAAKKRADKE